MCVVVGFSAKAESLYGYPLALYRGVALCRFEVEEEQVFE
jgi:hypothetical protein